MSERLETLIVGGGITGLAAALRLHQAGRADWMLVERDSRLGGKIRTDQVNGCVIEAGPDSFLASKPGGVALCRELGIDGKLVGTSPHHRRTYVRRGGRLHEIPEGFTGLVPTRLGPLLTSSVLSLRGRVRAALELFVPPREGDDDESIASFFARRFGREAYEWLIEPLVSGIFAGDGRALSLHATFPQLADIEREHRSVMRAMLAQPRRTAAGSPTDRDPGRGFVTLPGGLIDLVDAIERRLPGSRLRRATAVESLRQVPGGFAVTLHGGDVVIAGSVVLAIPAHHATDLVAPLDHGLADSLRAIPFVSTATISVMLSADVVARPLDGYGFVSPRAGGGPLVACTWTSNKFPMRAPDGALLIRFFIGRAGDDAIVGATDTEIEAWVRSELALLGITAEPSYYRIYRWPWAMPQYNLGHLGRVEAIETAARRHRGLLMAGASYGGVGIPDCIVSGQRAADRALQLAGFAPASASAPAAT